MATKKTIIGIDPDVERSGVARLDMDGGSPSLSLWSMEFGELARFLLSLRDEAAKGGFPVSVVVEAGWLNHGNWHLRWSDTGRLACAKGYQVGRNHETGRKMVELCRGLGFLVIEQRPLRKMWSGKDRKITAAELRVVTGYGQRSTQDARDAALLAWVQAGLPLKADAVLKSNN